MSWKVKVTIGEVSAEVEIPFSERSHISLEGDGTAGKTLEILEQLTEKVLKTSTEEEWEEFEIRFQKSLANAEDDLDRNWIKESGISHVIPFKMPGPKGIETWEEARQAAINMSKHLS